MKHGQPNQFFAKSVSRIPISLGKIAEHVIQPKRGNKFVEGRDTVALCDIIAPAGNGIL